jgi:two-component system cell cycle sensor histidine kinase/response regulator CckA
MHRTSTHGAIQGGPKGVEKESLGWTSEEKTLAESEERYRTLVEASRDVIYTLCEEGKFTSLNPAFETVTGWPAAEWLGKHLESIIHPDDWPAELSLLELMLSGETPPRQEVRVRSKSGDYLVAESMVTPQFQNGKFTGVLGIARDVTERKRAEEALKESEERYRQLVENMSEAVYILDQKGVITYVSAAIESLLGYRPAEVIGRPFADFICKEDLPQVRERFDAVLSGKIGASEYRVFDKSGHLRWILASSKPSFAEGTASGLQGVLSDITERKDAEEEKDRLEARLRQAQKLEALGTLASGIAHNFNNLLMTIQGNASLMLLDTDSTHPHYQNLKSIEQQVQNGATLTRQLLGYAREGGHTMGPVDLNKVVEDIAAAFGTTKKQIRVHTELAESLSPVRADSGQMEQVLLNLFINAADAMAGGGDLFVSTMNITDTVVTGKPYRTKPGSYVLLRVKDTGCGMDTDTMERIFDPFFTTKGIGKGTGLGLSSAYGIVKAHGGHIDVDSEKEQGTTVSIYLPALNEAVPAAVEPDEKIKHGEETILLVDDEALVLEVGAKMLTKLGYTVFEARGGREAVEIYKAKKDKIDVVILDQIMPDMTGAAVYDQLKQINGEVKVLLSSGYSLHGERNERMKQGCNGFISKPFKIQALSAKIRAICDLTSSS